jgi:hypothetical protein
VSVQRIATRLIELSKECIVVKTERVQLGEEVGERERERKGEREAGG